MIRGSNEDREFEASTNFFEPALIGEYYFVKNKAENSYLFSKGRGKGFGSILKSLDFYAFTGIGGFNYSVKGNDDLENHGYWNLEDLLLLFLLVLDQHLYIHPILILELNLAADMHFLITLMVILHNIPAQMTFIIFLISLLLTS